MNLHPLLQRQLRKAGLSQDLNGVAPEVATLARAVSAAYEQADDARQLAERAQAIASGEMSQLHDSLSIHNQSLQGQIDLATADMRSALEHSKLMRDIAERARVAAEQASRTKSDFLANMSHEIRTPMTAILGFTELVADPELPAAERLAFARTIRRNGEHLLGLINDILDISKIEAGSMTLETIPTSPLAVLEEVLSFCRPKVLEKKLWLREEVDYPIPATMLSDPLRLRQILINLVSNAVKFTEQGGVTIGMHCRDNNVHFAVTDTGIGMTDKQRGKLFKPFTQADETMSRRFGGTGLGLAITHRLVTMMSGAVHVVSEPGKGTTFRVEIPVGIANPEMLGRPERRVDAMELVRPGQGMLNGRRVLLVEDGTDNQRLISFYLSKAGAEVEIADNGQEGVQEVEASLQSALPFDVILMDMQMPVMDGYEAARQIRNLAVETPIVALTAHAMAGDRERCLAAGCDEYLTKPVDRAKLIALIRGLIDAQNGGQGGGQSGNLAA